MPTATAEGLTCKFEEGMVLMLLSEANYYRSRRCQLPMFSPVMLIAEPYNFERFE